MTSLLERTVHNSADTKPRAWLSGPYHLALALQAGLTAALLATAARAVFSCQECPVWLLRPLGHAYWASGPGVCNEICNEILHNLLLLLPL